MIRECIGIAPGAKFSVDEARFIKLRFQKMNLKERQIALFFMLLPITSRAAAVPSDEQQPFAKKSRQTILGYALEGNFFL